MTSCVIITWHTPEKQKLSVVSYTDFIDYGCQRLSDVKWQERTFSDFNVKEGRKVFCFFNFVSWYQTFFIYIPKSIIFLKFKIIQVSYSLKNDKFEFLKLILSLKTMINRTFFEPSPPPPP